MGPKVSLSEAGLERKGGLVRELLAVKECWCTRDVVIVRRAQRDTQKVPVPMTECGGEKPEQLQR